MAVAIFGAADVHFAGHARLHVGFESSGSKQVLEELDIHGSGTVCCQGTMNGSTKDSLATTVGLVAYYFLAFREGGEDGKGGQDSGKVKVERLHIQGLVVLEESCVCFCNVNQWMKLAFYEPFPCMILWTSLCLLLVNLSSLGLVIVLLFIFLSLSFALDLVFSPC